jgi:tetratricopeptide (TPR) repeat protein
MSDVFISYSTRDRPVVTRICEALESHGIPCWIAPRDIVPGADWSSSIINGIANCRVMLLVFTASSNDSPQVRREIERAVNKHVPVIPLRIENIALGQSLEYFLSTSQWLDAHTEPLEDHLDYLIEVLRRLIDTPPVTPEPAPASLPSPQAAPAPAPAPARPRPRPAAPVHAPVATEPAPKHRARLPLILSAAGAVLLLLAAGGVWLEWGAISRLPMLASILGPGPKPIVAAAPGHLTIALAHLEGDKDDEHEKLLLDRLTNDFEGAETTEIDRTITLPDAPTAQESLTLAKAKAGELRAEAGADVLLWGRVVTLEGKSVMRLYWTTGETVTGAKASGVYGVKADTVALPELFWSDLKQVLGLLLQSRLAEVTKQQTGRYSADKLAPLIAQVRKLLQAQQGSWSADTDAKVRSTFADALCSYGDQAGNADALRESIEAYQRVLTEWTRESAPQDWATAQNGLGNALQYLGQLESGTERYQASVAAYRAALLERTRDRAPLDWAQTQNALGSVLDLLGERESGTQNLEESVVAFRAAMEVRTRDRLPLDWAREQNNLGNALVSLGQREPGTGRLREAVAAFRAALEERTREHAPLDWADTETNLGTALEKLGEREADDPKQQKADLQQSVAAVSSALEELSKPKEPTYWAMAQQQLGDSLRALGQTEASAEDLEKAAAALRAALDVFTRDDDPVDWGDVQNSLGATLLLWGQREKNDGYLNDAVTALRAALTERTQARVPLDWAQTQLYLGQALAALGTHARSAARLAEAVTSLHAAVDGYHQAGDVAGEKAALAALQSAQAASAQIGQ